MNRWTGLIVSILILGGVGAVLLLNLDTGGHPTPPVVTGETPRADADAPAGEDTPGPDGAFREYFIGDPEEREDAALEIRAVWFPAVAMDGMTAPTGRDVVHLEADIVALANNPNGFARGEFVPYLKIAYEIEPAGGGESIVGELLPMVARDGLHYGANVALPGAGKYRLTYRVEPPSAGGLGRHADPTTGVGPWWSPFAVSWDWDYAPPAG